MRKSIPNKKGKAAIKVICILLVFLMFVNLMEFQPVYAAKENVDVVNADSIVMDAPFMGWNSFDSFYDSSDLNENNIKAVVDFMAENMRDSGYIYINLDGGWWNNTGGSGVILIDEHGRPIPGAVRFPSSDIDSDSNGKKDGLKPLADYIHSKGLKLGIYAMRGIPRAANNHTVSIDPKAIEAAAAATGRPVNQLTGAQITNIADISSWTNDNYGLNWDTHPDEALAYYVSLFQLWEEWGVDLIKIDDLNDSPHAKYTNYPNQTPPYRQADIEAYAKAREIAGSDIMISGSPGRGLTGERVDNILEQLDTMRISADVWDSWADVNKLFAPAKEYVPYTYDKPGKYIDLDMLPFGTLKDKTNNPYRSSKLTKDEMITSMTLHLIARSPLIMGGVLYKLDMNNEIDKFTLDMLTNKEALAVNQKGANPKPFYDAGNITKWVSDGEDSTKYVALFNRNGSTADISFDFSDPNIGLSPAETYNIRDLWAKEYVGSFKGSYSVSVPGHGAVLYKVIPATIEEGVPTLSMTTSSVAINAGESKTIKTILINQGLKDVSNVIVDLELPSGWSASPVAGSYDSIASLSVAQSHSIEWNINVPETASVTDNVVITKAQYYETGTSFNKQISTKMTVIPAVMPEGFTDDFSIEKINWTDAGVGTWTIVDEGNNKILKQTASSSGNSTTRSEYRTTVTGRTWMDAIYEVDVRYDGISRSNDLSKWVTLMFRKSAQDNSFRQDTYFLYWRINGELTLAKGPSGTALGSYQAPPLSTATTASEWHNLKVVNIGNRFQVYIDNSNTPVIDVIDSTSPFTVGYAGLGANASAWSFDDFNVRVEGDLVQTSGIYDQNVRNTSDPDNVIEIPVVLFNKTVWNTYLIDSEGHQTELGLNDGDDYEKETSDYVTTYTLTPSLLNSMDTGSYTFQIVLSDGSTVDFALKVVDTTSRTPVINQAGDTTITYDDSTIDLSEVNNLFDVDRNAGRQTYSIETDAVSTGEGTIADDHKTLTIIKPGIFKIGLVTGKTSSHEAGEKVIATLTVNRGNAFELSYEIKIQSTDTSERTFDLNNIIGEVDRHSDVQYELGTLADPEGILKGTSLSGTTLSYQGTGKVTGDATQTIVVKSENYLDSTILVRFSATEDGSNVDVPIGLTATTIDDSKIELNWNVVQNAEGYNIYRAEMIDGLYDKLNSTTVTAATYTDTGLTAETSYFYVVTALQEGMESMYSVPVSATTKAIGEEPEEDHEAPFWSNESKVTVSNVDTTNVELSWDAAGDNIAVTGYKVMWKMGNTEKSIQISGDVTSTLINYLQPNTSYTFRVEAFDAAGNGSTDGPSVVVRTKSIYYPPVVQNPTEPEQINEPKQPEIQQPELEQPVPEQSAEQEHPIQTPIEFIDVPATHWAADTINRAAALGIVQGNPDNTFKPNAAITRAEFITMLANAFKWSGGFSELTFKDNGKIGTWARDSIAQGVERGVIGGYTDGHFRPNQEITRTELVVMLTRALGLSITDINETNFADDAVIPLWGKGEVKLLNQMSLIKGRSNNRFAPHAKATRSEALVFLMRAIEQKARVFE
ncbi:S-layer homology domain-containing protein [Paenibacillus amylolyticus]|uniref:S-layer homology domain-containing protein n=1 Tax=Paenibacillus amylolyticus TaxID=1451 RepID=UPI0032420904